MSDKNLTELEWKKFNKSKKLEDKDFVKALAALESGTRAKDAAAQNKALDDIEKHAAKLRSANKADKELGRYLDDADKEIALERKRVALDARQAAKQADAGEDEEGPALMTSRMLPLLRQVPKAEEPFSATVAALGKKVAVLVSRREIGASQRKLLTGALGGTGGVKFMNGQCIWEANTITFVLEARVASLPKLIRAALLEQTGNRFKVRVRGEDPNDVDGDEEGDEGPEGETAETDSAAAPPVAAESPDKAAYLSRLAELEPQVTAAVGNRVADAAKLQALLGFAKGKAAEDKYAAGLQSLEMVDKLLHAAPAPQPAPDAAAQLTAALTRLTPQIQQAVTAHPERRVELLTTVKDFQALLKGGQLAEAGELLRRVQALIATETPRKPARPPAKPVAPIWQRASEQALEQSMSLILALRALADSEADRMADDLMDKLNDHMSAVGETLDQYDDAAPDERADFATDARDFLREQQSDIADDPLLTAADENPFELKLDIRNTLRQALDEITAAFEA